MLYVILVVRDLSWSRSPCSWRKQTRQWLSYPNAEVYSVHVRVW